MIVHQSSLKMLQVYEGSNSIRIFSEIVLFNHIVIIHVSAGQYAVNLPKFITMSEVHLRQVIICLEPPVLEKLHC